jgi:EAL domain-containing protein (putative c-di-GMP-specific phosphodiesterase class I)
MEQGDEGHAAYIIEEGSIEILVEKENGLIQSLGTRGAGSIIGEMALVDNKPRTATIKTIEDSTLLEITREDFENRLDTTDPVVRMIMQVILARYRDMIARSHILQSPKSNVTPEDLEKNLVDQTNAVDELKLINEIKKSISNKDFILHYQPIIDIQKNKISGFEALIRWNHPERGLIYPDQFISAAENSGLITELSRFVVEESCQFLSELQKNESVPDSLFISVNFTAKDFLVNDFKDHILKNLKDNDLRTDQLHIEITERLLMNEPHQAQEVLEECRKDGMVVSIDDFGTGYSSLSYLHHFPIDILKIDRSFIINMQEDESAHNLVSSVISLGHNIGMSIIAEGIEKKEQSEMLKKMGCDKIQGYFYSRPIPEQDVLEYLSKPL